jgi:hypothetical protein
VLVSRQTLCHVFRAGDSEQAGIIIHPDSLAWRAELVTRAELKAAGGPQAG